MRIDSIKPATYNSRTSVRAERIQDCVLKETYNTDSEYIDKLMEEVYSKIEIKAAAIHERRDKRLKELFGVEDFVKGL